MNKDAKPNQDAKFVRFNREFVITVTVITEFDCMQKGKSLFRRLFVSEFGDVTMNVTD